MGGLGWGDIPDYRDLSGDRRSCVLGYDVKI